MATHHFEPTSSLGQFEELHIGAVSIVRELGDDERDPEVGRMFEVRYGDGGTVHAFADELTEIAS